jgi:hypothetical protein
MNQTAKAESGYLDSPIYNFVQVKPLDFKGKNFNLVSNPNPTHLQDSVRKSYNRSQNTRYNEHGDGLRSSVPKVHSTLKQLNRDICKTNFSGLTAHSSYISRVGSSLKEYGEINPNIVPCGQPLLRASFQRNSQQKLSMKTVFRKPAAFREFVPPLATRFVPLEP